MKNIHLLPTDKPSRLINYLKDNSWDLFNNPMPKVDNVVCQQIFITNDKKIKEGDYYHILSTKEILRHNFPIKIKDDGDHRKIILTTDQDLIKDGVQTIPDEFLEWFCSKNGKVDFVEVIAIKDEKN